MQTTKVRIGLITYNRFSPWYRRFLKLIGAFLRINFLLFEEMFTENGQKSEENADKPSQKWHSLLAQQQGIDYLLFFIGKKKSGSLKIIDRVMIYIENAPEKVFFVSCPHDKKEKDASLKRHGMLGRRVEFNDMDFHREACPDIELVCNDSLALIHLALLVVVNLVLPARKKQH